MTNPEPLPAPNPSLTVIVNGKISHFPHGTTIRDLLDHFQQPANTVLVERNGVALHRHEFAVLSLQPNDRIEIIRIAAGG